VLEAHSSASYQRLCEGNGSRFGEIRLLWPTMFQKHLGSVVFRQEPRDTELHTRKPAEHYVQRALL
jgi:hypothetical protein